MRTIGRVAPRERAAGFSLIELSMVLVVLGVLFGAVIRPVVAEYENRVLEDTRRALDDAREALLGYVAAHGYFPCPAIATSGGAEVFVAVPPGSHTDGACLVSQGLLPAATLGLTSLDSAGFAVDGHRRPENRLRYAVFMQTVEGVTNPFTRLNGMRSIGLMQLDQDYFHICGGGINVTPGTNCNTEATLNTRAVAVIWSVGGNGAIGTASPHELENLNGDRLFVTRARSIVAGVEFDDMLMWVPIHVAVNRMTQTGKLP